MGNAITVTMLGKFTLRELRRSHGQAQILLVCLNRDELPLERRAVLMKQLETVLTESLRAGDPFTRMGASRYMVLLAGASRENGEMISQRILNRPKTENLLLFDIIWRFLKQMPQILSCGVYFAKKY